jgi:hypothetical protein
MVVWYPGFLCRGGRGISGARREERTELPGPAALLGTDPVLGVEPMMDERISLIASTERRSQTGCNHALHRSVFTECPLSSSRQPDQNYPTMACWDMRSTFRAWQLCAPAWAFTAPQFSYSIASSQVASQKGLSFTVMLRTDCECGHRVIQFVEAWP